MNHEPEIKMVRGSVVIKLQPDHVSEMTEEALLKLFNKIKNREYVIHVNGIDWDRWRTLRSRIATLLRKRYIRDYYFDLDERTTGSIHGTITLCYNEIH